MRGFDKYALNHQLLLSVSMDEVTALGAGLDITHDLAKPHHLLTLQGTPAVWGNLPSGLPYLSFDGAADYLECLAADSIDLNFTNEDWSMAAWLYNHGPAGAEIIMSQGVVDVDGWEFFVFSHNLSLRTCQTPPDHTDISAVDAFAFNAWQLVGVTRHGASGQFYVNGLPVATTLGVGLTDPTDVAGGDALWIGKHTTGEFWHGYMGGGPCGPRIWSPRVLSASDWRAIFESERHWFGV